MLKGWIKSNLFVVLWWSRFILTIFRKKHAEKCSTTLKISLKICFVLIVLMMAPIVAGRRLLNTNSSVQRQKEKSKLKLEYLFSASFLIKMVKIRCDRHKTTNRFDFIHLFSNENPSYPNWHDTCPTLSKFCVFFNYLGR